MGGGGGGGGVFIHDTVRSHFSADFFSIILHKVIQLVYSDRDIFRWFLFKCYTKSLVCYDWVQPHLAKRISRFILSGQSNGQSTDKKKGKKVTSG